MLIFAIGTFENICQDAMVIVTRLFYLSRIQRNKPHLNTSIHYKDINYPKSCIINSEYVSIYNFVIAICKVPFDRYNEYKTIK